MMSWWVAILDQRFKLQGAVHRMMNRKLSMAWEQWQVEISIVVTQLTKWRSIQFWFNLD